MIRVRQPSCFQHLLIIVALGTLFFHDAVSFAEEFGVQFRLSSPVLSEDSTVYLTGAGSQLGNWRPDARLMDYAGSHVWTCRQSFSEPQKLEYKYTLGDWSKEGADANGSPLPNFRREVDGSVEIVDRIDRWTKPRPRNLEGQITGTVRYHRQLSHEGLRDRDAVVWLPPGYEKSTARYPVLYMQDGQNIVDPATSAIGVDWQVDETCTRLIADKAIPALIVVGIYNTQDRSQEYLLGEKSKLYRNFVVDTVKPFVDREYRTKPSREFTLVGGSSAGGLCAFVLAWERADVFSKAICMSPAFKFESADKKVAVDYVAQVASSPPPKNSLTLYIDNGGTKIDERLQPGVDAMLGVLRSKGFVDDENLHYFRDPAAPHGEAAWAKRFPAAIKNVLRHTSNDSAIKADRGQ